MSISEFEDEEQQPTGHAQRNFTIIPNGILLADIQPSSLKVYMALRSYLRPGHPTFPKAESVCTAFRIPRRTFAAALKELQDAGLLVVGKRSYAGGMRRTNVYFFPDVDDIPRRADTALSPDTTDDTQQSANLASLKEEEKAEEEKENTSPLPGLEQMARELATKEFKAREQRAVDESFAKFWDLWPKKVAKKDAEKIWPKALKAAGSLERIMDGVYRVRATVDQKLTEPQYLPNPDRWLRGERWTDMEVKQGVKQGVVSPLVGDKRYHSGPNILDQLTDDELDQLVAMARAEGRQFNEADARRVIESRKS